MFPAGVNEAWRTFCRHVGNFIDITSVAVHGLKRAKKLSRYRVDYKNFGAVMVGHSVKTCLGNERQIAKNVTNK